MSRASEWPGPSRWSKISIHGPSIISFWSYCTLSWPKTTLHTWIRYTCKHREWPWAPPVHIPIPIFGDESLQSFLNHVLCWYRFIDDLFVILTGTESSLIEFIEHLNNNQFNLRVTFTYDCNHISFLDLKINKDPTGQIRTDLYRKPRQVICCSMHPVPTSILSYAVSSMASIWGYVATAQRMGTSTSKRLLYVSAY